MWDIGQLLSRWLLSTINFIILVPSVLVLVAGLMLVLVPVHMSDLVLQVVSRCDIPAHHQQYVMATVSTTILRETGVLMICLASVFALPSFLGYVGSSNYIRPCLVLYLVPLITLWTMELVLLIVYPGVKQFVMAGLQLLLQTSLDQYRGTSGTKDLLSLVWDHVMVNLGCCGSNSYLDFTNSTTWASTRSGMQIVPASCCIIDQEKYPAIEPVDGHCIYVPTKYNSHWTQGCLSSVLRLMSDHLPLLMLGLVLLLALQLLVIVTALCLCCLHRDKKSLQTILISSQNVNSRPGFEA